MYIKDWWSFLVSRKRGFLQTDFFIQDVPWVRIDKSRFWQRKKCRFWENLDKAGLIRSKTNIYQNLFFYFICVQLLEIEANFMAITERIKYNKFNLTHLLQWIQNLQLNSQFTKIWAFEPENVISIWITRQVTFFLITKTKTFTS